MEQLVKCGLCEGGGPAAEPAAPLLGLVEGLRQSHAHPIRGLPARAGGAQPCGLQHQGEKCEHVEELLLFPPPPPLYNECSITNTA